MLFKCYTKASKLGKLSSGHRTGKKNFIPIPKKGNVKECWDYHTFALISHASKVMLKSFKLGLSGTWTDKFQMYLLGLEESEEPEIKLATLVGSWRKQGSFRKTSTSASLTKLKPLTVWITTNWKTLQEMGKQTTLPVSWEICMQVTKQQLELDME